jgi:hypothetical protein
MNNKRKMKKKIGGGVLMNKTFGNINLDLLESMKWLQSESLVKGVQKFLK